MSTKTNGNTLDTTTPVVNLTALRDQRTAAKKDLAAKEKSLAAKLKKLDAATKARTHAGQEYDTCKAERNALQAELAKLDDAIDAEIRRVQS